METLKAKNALQRLPSSLELSGNFGSPPTVALDTTSTASKHPGREYSPLQLEAQQSFDGGNRFQQGLPAGLAEQDLLASASNETLETEQSETDRKRLQGLGLYVLSTLLLSVQATTAKALGEYLFDPVFLLLAITAVPCHVLICKITFTSLYTGKRGVSTSVMIMARSLAILFGAIMPIMHQRPSNLWGSK